MSQIYLAFRFSRWEDNYIMQRFLSSAWFPFCAALVLAAGCAGAFVVLKPLGADVDNQEILKAFRIAGWAAGPVIALLALLTMLILNGVRRILRLRSVGFLHPIVVLLGLAPWVVFGFQLTYREPRFTPFGRAAIDFVGVPLWWSSLLAVAFTVLVSLPLLVPQKKR